MVGVVGGGALSLLRSAVQVWAELGYSVVVVDLSSDKTAEKIFSKLSYCKYRRFLGVPAKDGIMFVYSDYEWHSAFLDCSKVWTVVDLYTTKPEQFFEFVSKVRVKYSVILITHPEVSDSVFQYKFKPNLYKKCPVYVLELKQRDIGLYIELIQTGDSVINAHSARFFVGVEKFLLMTFDFIERDELVRCIQEFIFGRLRD